MSFYIKNREKTGNKPSLADMARDFAMVDKNSPTPATSSNAWVNEAVSRAPNSSSSIPGFAAQLVDAVSAVRGDAPGRGRDPSGPVASGVAPGLTDWAKRRALMRVNSGVR